MKLPQKKIYIIRHGETSWTLNGQHTGTTDIPLTKNGESQAEKLKARLSSHPFEAIFTSPLQRARCTCEIAGLFENAKIDPDLSEWNYGDFEGLTTEQIRKENPDWNIFSHGAPHGESPEAIYQRATRMLTKLQSFHGDVALFSHGHFSRALATCFLELSVSQGKLFALFPASVSILGLERSAHVLTLWNDISHLQ